MRRLVPLIAAVAALAACSPEPDQAAAQPVAPAFTTSALPACKSLFVPGGLVDVAKAKDGCTDPHGAIVSASAFSCADGRQLFQMDASSGAPAGWGFSGGKYTAADGEIAADPKYKAAYEKCNG